MQEYYGFQLININTGEVTSKANLESAVLSLTDDTIISVTAFIPTTQERYLQYPIAELNSDDKNVSKRDFIALYKMFDAEKERIKNPQNQAHTEE